MKRERLSICHLIDVLRSMSAWGLASCLWLLAGCGTSQLTIDEMIERAAALCDRGRGQEALLLLEQVVASSPNAARPYYLKGLAHELHQEYELARQAYDQCIRLSPDNSDALNNRGVVLAKLGFLDLAIADLTRATQLNPIDALAWSNLALAHHDRGSFDAALDNYRRSADIDRNPQVLVQIGNVYLDTEDFGKSEEFYSQAIELDQQNAHAYLNRSIARLELGKHEEALHDLEMAKKFDSEKTLLGPIQDMRSRLARSSQTSNPTDRPESQASSIESIERAVGQWLAIQGWMLEPNDQSDFAYRIRAVDTSSTSMDSTRHPVMATETLQSGSVAVAPKVSADEDPSMLDRASLFDHRSSKTVNATESPQATRPLLLLTCEPMQEVVCDYRQAAAALQSKSPVALVVVDPQQIAEGRLGLVHVDLQWKPQRRDFFTKTLTLKNIPAIAEVPTPPEL